MRYEKYKGSGIEWIGEIPEKWDIVKIKYLFKIGRGRVISTLELNEGKTGYPVYSSQTLNNGLLGYIDTYDFDCCQITWTTDGAYAGTTYLRQGKHNCTNVCGTLQLRNEEKQNIRYYSYAMERIVPFYKRRDTNGYKIMNNEMADIKITVPKLFEQEKIVAYLDDKTSQIDSIIKDLEREKDKLEQYKRELIANVVTKGIDSNVPMKDSGVDWIGQVPEDWEVKKIKWIFEILKRQNGRDERPVLSITQQGIKIKDIENNDGQMAESYENYQLVEPGDFAMNSMDLLTGWIDCSQYEGVTSPDYRVFRLIDANGHNNDFYNYLFQMCYTRRIFYRIGQGVSNLGRWRLQREPFLNMKIPVPPKEEQENISNFIRIKENKINMIVSEVDKQIEKLKEYRKILIHEAVTGKVKIDGGAN